MRTSSPGEWPTSLLSEDWWLSSRTSSAIGARGIRLRWRAHAGGARGRGSMHQGGTSAPALSRPSETVGASRPASIALRYPERRRRASQLGRRPWRVRNKGPRAEGPGRRIAGRKRIAEHLVDLILSPLKRRPRRRHGRAPVGHFACVRHHLLSATARALRSRGHDRSLAEDADRASCIRG